MDIHPADRISEFAKNAFKAPFNLLGLELRRKRPRRHNPRKDPSPPPLYADPLEALHEIRGGQKATFQCPVDRIVDLKGLRFHRDSWHPFVAAIEGYVEGGKRQAGLVLDRYYAEHQPQNAGEAILGLEQPPLYLKQAAPHLYYLSPWEGRPAEIIDSIVRSWTARENTEHGGRGLMLDPHGFMLQGPVHKDKRDLELKRLVTTADSIRQLGFDRSLGHANFRMLKRNDEFAFAVDGGGYHRTAAMAALGYDWIPGSFFPGPTIIDIADVDYWPQVRRGIWSREEATAYFNHLFDFDSRAWAKQRGLC